jgi:hypothetical protein
VDPVSDNSIRFHEKSLFLAIVFGCGRVDVEASQSEFRGFKDPAANRAFEWLARVEATT